MKTKQQLCLLLTIVIYAAGKPLSKAAVRNKLLLISFDGFRWDYDQDVDTPHLDRLVVDGVKAKYITPPMLTMTGPSHFTTITGNTQLLIRKTTVIISGNSSSFSIIMAMDVLYECDNWLSVDFVC